MRITAGYGDGLTWGPCTSSSDPRASLYTKHFDTQVGIGSLDVTVTAELWRHGPLHQIVEVKHQGVEVIGLLSDEQIEQLEKKAVEV